MEGLRRKTYEIDEQRVAWEGLASSCASLPRRLGAFAVLGFFLFTALTTAVVLFYNVFGERVIEGQGVHAPASAFYATLATSAAVVLFGFGLWLVRSLGTYRAFARVLRDGGHDPYRPTRDGLAPYSDEQLLALRVRYERMVEGKKKSLFERLYGFRSDDSFSLGPLSALPGTFEMDTLRVEWETNLILSRQEDIPEVSWWTEGRMELLPRKLDEHLRLAFTLAFTEESVRMLKRRYGYRTDRWHATVPEGKLWDAVRDHEQARRTRATLQRRRG